MTDPHPPHRTGQDSDGERCVLVLDLVSSTSEPCSSSSTEDTT